MVITGVQAAGAKGVSAVQGAVVDTKDGARAGTAAADQVRAADAPVRPGDPQPVVFPRKGLPVGQRPIELRREHAQARYQSYGGDHDDAA
jgi:hypothetical protein